ncbi:hypothetical protein Acr_20g0006910 [Actinidia rufa]|uniref:Uncharacterized protein n=1 Tax=Actinidia rufa TaxID=165716 RepID=A0A7J0GDK1_9ERIC|nr:hypothetical protein Acr_20g0006910 [Actinidia rufa]
MNNFAYSLRLVAIELGAQISFLVSLGIECVTEIHPRLGSLKRPSLLTCGHGLAIRSVIHAYMSFILLLIPTFLWRCSMVISQLSAPLGSNRPEFCLEVALATLCTFSSSLSPLYQGVLGASKDERRGNQSIDTMADLWLCRYLQPFARLTVNGLAANIRIVRPTAGAVFEKQPSDCQVSRPEILERESVCVGAVKKNSDVQVTLSPNTPWDYWAVASHPSSSAVNAPSLLTNDISKLTMNLARMAVAFSHDCSEL